MECSSISGTSHTVVLTSFPPSLVRTNAGERLADYDRLCVRSWIECGFHILAFNTADEIPPLAARYPEIEFVPAPRTAHAVFGKDTPFIADMLATLAQRPEPVLGIINSDLLFEPAAAWRDLPSMVANKTLLVGQRYDVRTLSSGAMYRYFPGFDHFFFGRAAAEELAPATQPFSMGLPWWDYWFPLSLMLRGYDVQCVTRPAVLHLAHDQAVIARTAAWRNLAREFARAMVREAEGGNQPASQHWPSLLELSRRIDGAGEEELESGALDQPIVDMSMHSVPLIAGKMFQMITGASAPTPDFLPRGTFEDVPDRIIAGTAMHRALWDDSHGDPARARANFELALKKASMDPGVVLECGNYFLRLGDKERAANLFARGVELVPRSAPMLNSLGSVLTQQGRNDEAAGCFERALASDPLYGASYYNLALLMWLKNRHMEVVSRLEQRLAQSPQFAEGREWLQRIRETIARFDSNASLPHANR